MQRILNPPTLSPRERRSQGERIACLNGATAVYFVSMNLRDGSSVVADLTTVGRKSGQPRTVELRFIYSNGSFFASSSRVQGKHWCQNMLKNPAVTLTIQGEKLSCTARQVTDEKLRRQMLMLRDSPPRMDRVVFEITPHRPANLQPG